MPWWFIVFMCIVFVTIAALIAALIVFDPPLLRRRLDRLARRPPWAPDDRDVAAGRCGVKRRSIDAISCYWPCNLDAGHGGMHQWNYDDAEGGGALCFTDDEARRSWQGMHG